MHSELKTPVDGRAQSGGLLDRVKSLLASPRGEWPIIAAEPATAAGLYTGYFMLLAAIPAVFGFIKGSVIGYGAFGVTLTTPILAGVAGMVFGYVLGLVALYLVAMIVNALAPTFGGQKDQIQALKAVGYAWTAAWVAGVGVIVPWLGWLVALAGGVYSIYLLYLGLPHTMKCPSGKSLSYTAVSVVVAVLLSWIVALLLAGVTSMGGLAAGRVIGGGGSSGGSKVRIDGSSRLGQLAEFGRRMEEAGRQVEAARSNGDGNAQGRALEAMMGALAGGTDIDGQPVEAVAPEELRELLPETLGGRRRTSTSAGRSGAMGVQLSEAEAEYSSADAPGRGVSVRIKDMVAVSGMMAMAGAFSVDQSSETDSGYERTYARDGRIINEEWNSNSNRGKYGVTVGNRFQIEASGDVDSIDELRRIVERLEREVAVLR